MIRSDYGEALFRRHAHLILVPQHNSDDITSGRFARIENEDIVFDLKNIKVTKRDELDRQAKKLSIS